MAVPTLQMCPYFWLTPDEGVAKPLYFLFKGCCYGQCLLMGLARLLSTEASLLPLLGVLLLGGLMTFDWDLAAVSGASLCFCPGQSSKEDTISSIISGSLGGDPSSLHSLYTSRYKDWISSLLVWGPTSWMVYMSTSESSFGNSCWWPQHTIHSTSFHPWSAVCWNIL